jgi:hypothetical protein
MEQDQTSKIFRKIFKKVLASGEKWDHIIARLKRSSEREDHSIIFIDIFERVMKSFEIEISSKEKEKLLLAFPAKSEGSRHAINIGRLYDLKFDV